MDSFQMSADYYPTDTTGIPMYGIKSLTVAKELLTQGVDAQFAGQIDMIRSLCRIDVSERISNAMLYPDGEIYPKVTEVEMVSWIDHGYLRPRFDDYSQGLKFANLFPTSPVSTPAVARKTNDIFRLYCPEADVKDMKFRVTATLSPGEAPRQFEIGLGDFESEIGSELVRNHIYRFDIHAFNTMLDLDVEVSDWTVQQSEFELEDIVSMEPDGFLKWEYDDRFFRFRQKLITVNRSNSCQYSMVLLHMPPAHSIYCLPKARHGKLTLSRERTEWMPLSLWI